MLRCQLRDRYAMPARLLIARHARCAARVDIYYMARSRQLRAALISRAAPLMFFFMRALKALRAIRRARILHCLREFRLLMLLLPRQRALLARLPRAPPLPCRAPMPPRC